MTQWGSVMQTIQVVKQLIIISTHETIQFQYKCFSEWGWNSQNTMGPSVPPYIFQPRAPDILIQHYPQEIRRIAAYIESLIIVTRKQSMTIRDVPWRTSKPTNLLQLLGRCARHQEGDRNHLQQRSQDY